MGPLTYRAASRRLRPARNTLCACLISTLIVSSFSSVSAANCAEDGWISLPNLASLNISTIGAVTKGDAGSTGLPSLFIGKGSFTQGAAWLGAPVGLLDEFRVSFQLDVTNAGAGHCPDIYTETCSTGPTTAAECAANTVTTLTDRYCPATVTTCQSLATPSTQCGSEGVAFVIQNQDSLALGTGKSGLGYRGIRDAVAVEFDLKESGGTDGRGQHMAVRASPKGRSNRENTQGNEDSLSSVESMSLYTASSSGSAAVARVTITNARCNGEAVATEASLTTQFSTGQSTTVLTQTMDLPSYIYERNDGNGLQTRPKVLGSLEQAKTAYIGFTGAVGREPTQFAIRSLDVKLRRPKNLYFGSTTQQTCQDAQQIQFGSRTCLEYARNFTTTSAQLLLVSQTASTAALCTCTELKKLFESRGSSNWLNACTTDRERIGNMCQQTCTNVCQTSVVRSVVTTPVESFKQKGTVPVRIQVVPSSLDHQSGFYTSPVALQLLEVKFDKADKCRVTNKFQVETDETKGIFEFHVVCLEGTSAVANNKYTGEFTAADGTVRLPFTVEVQASGAEAKTPYYLGKKEANPFLQFFSGVAVKQYFTILDSEGSSVDYGMNLNATNAMPISLAATIKDNGVERVEHIEAYPDTEGLAQNQEMVASLEWVPQLATEEGVYISGVRTPFVEMHEDTQYKTPVFHGYLDPATLYLKPSVEGTIKANDQPLEVVVTGRDTAGNPLTRRAPFPVYEGQVFSMESRNNFFPIKLGSLRISSVVMTWAWQYPSLHIESATAQYYKEFTVSGNCPPALPACPTSESADLLPACCHFNRPATSKVWLGVSFFMEGDFDYEDGLGFLLMRPVGSPVNGATGLACNAPVYQQHPATYLKDPANALVALALYDQLPSSSPLDMRFDLRSDSVKQKLVSDVGLLASQTVPVCVGNKFFKAVSGSSAPGRCLTTDVTPVARAPKDFCDMFPSFMIDQEASFADQSWSMGINSRGAGQVSLSSFNHLELTVRPPVGQTQEFSNQCGTEESPLEFLTVELKTPTGDVYPTDDAQAVFGGACPSVVANIDASIAGDWVFEVTHPCEGSSFGCTSSLTLNIAPGDAHCLSGTADCPREEDGLYTVQEPAAIRAGENFELRARLSDTFGNLVTARPDGLTISESKNCVIVPKLSMAAWNIKCAGPETFKVKFNNAETTLTVQPLGSFSLDGSHLKLFPAQLRACSYAAFVLASGNSTGAPAPLPVDMNKLLPTVKSGNVTFLGQDRNATLTHAGQTYEGIAVDLYVQGSPGSTVSLQVNYNSVVKAVEGTLLPGDVSLVKSTYTGFNHKVTTGQVFTVTYTPKGECFDKFTTQIEGAQIFLLFTKLDGTLATMRCTEGALPASPTSSQCNFEWKSASFSYEVKGVLLDAVRNDVADVKFSFPRVDYNARDLIHSTARAMSFIQTRRLASFSLSREHHAASFIQMEATHHMLSAAGETIDFTIPLAVAQQAKADNKAISVSAYTGVQTQASSGFTIVDTAGLNINALAINVAFDLVDSAQSGKARASISWDDASKTYMFGCLPSTNEAVSVVWNVMYSNVKVATATCTVLPVVSMAASTVSLVSSSVVVSGTPGSCPTASTCRVSVENLKAAVFEVTLRSSAGTAVSDNSQAQTYRGKTWALDVTINGVTTTLPAVVDTAASTSDATSTVRLKIDPSASVTKLVGSPASIVAKTTGAAGQACGNSVSVTIFGGRLDLVQSLPSDLKVTPNMDDEVSFTPKDANGVVLNREDLNAWLSALSTTGTALQVQFSVGSGSASSLQGIATLPAFDGPIKLPIRVSAEGTYSLTVTVGTQTRTVNLSAGFANFDSSMTVVTPGCCLPDFCLKSTVVSTFAVSGKQAHFIITPKDKAGNTLPLSLPQLNSLTVQFKNSAGTVMDPTQFVVTNSPAGQVSFTLPASSASETLTAQVQYSEQNTVQNVGASVTFVVRSPTTVPSSKTMDCPTDAWFGSSFEINHGGRVPPSLTTASGKPAYEIAVTNCDYASCTASNMKWAVTASNNELIRTSAPVSQTGAFAPNTVRVLYKVAADIESQMTSTCASTKWVGVALCKAAVNSQREPTAIALNFDKTTVGPASQVTVSASIGTQGSNDLFRMWTGASIKFDAPSGCTFTDSQSASTTKAASAYATSVQATFSCTVAGSLTISASIANNPMGKTVLPGSKTVTVTPGMVADISLGKSSLGPLPLDSTTTIAFSCNSAPGAWICCKDQYGNAVPDCNGLLSQTAWKEAYTYTESNTQAFIQLSGDETGTMTAAYTASGLVLGSSFGGVYTLTVKTSDATVAAKTASVTFSPGTISLPNSSLKCFKADADNNLVEMTSPAEVPAGTDVTCRVALKNDKNQAVAPPEGLVYMTVWDSKNVNKAEVGGVEIQRPFTEAGQYVVAPRLSLVGSLMTPSSAEAATTKFLIKVIPDGVSLGKSFVEFPSSVQSEQEFNAAVHWLDDYGNTVTTADGTSLGAKLCVCRTQTADFESTDNANPYGCLQVVTLGSSTSLKVTITLTKANMDINFLDKTTCESFIYTPIVEGVPQLTRVVPLAPVKVDVVSCSDCSYDVLTVGRKASCLLRAFDKNDVPVPMLKSANDLLEDSEKASLTINPDQCVPSGGSNNAVSAPVVQPVWRDLIQWCGDKSGAVVAGSSEGTKNGNNDFTIEFFPSAPGPLTSVACLKASIPTANGSFEEEVIKITDATNTPVVAPEAFEDSQGFGLLRFQIDVPQAPQALDQPDVARTVKLNLESGLVAAIAGAATNPAAKKEVTGSIVITNLAGTTSGVINGYIKYDSADTSANARLEALIADIAKGTDSTIHRSMSTKVKSIQLWLTGSTVTKVYSPTNLPAKARLVCPANGKVELAAGSTFLTSFTLTTVSGSDISGNFDTWLPFKTGAEASVRAQGSTMDSKCTWVAPSSGKEYALNCPTLTVSGTYELRLIVSTSTSQRNLLAGDKCTVSVKAGLPDPFRSVIEPIVPVEIPDRVSVNVKLRDAYGNPAPMGSMEAFMTVLSDSNGVKSESSSKVSVSSSDFSLSDIKVPQIANQASFRVLVFGTVDGSKVARQVEAVYTKASVRASSTNSEVADTCTDTSIECHDPKLATKFARVGSPADFRVIVRDASGNTRTAQPSDVAVCLLDPAVPGVCSPLATVTESGGALTVQYTPRSAGNWNVVVRLTHDSLAVSGGSFQVKVLPSTAFAFDVSTRATISASSNMRELLLKLVDSFGNTLSNTLVSDSRVRSALDAQKLTVTLSNKGCSCDRMCPASTCTMPLISGGDDAGLTDYERCSAGNLQRAGVWDVSIVDGNSRALPCNSESCSIRVVASSASPQCSLVIFERHVDRDNEAPVVVYGPADSISSTCGVKGLPDTANGMVVVDAKQAFRVLIDPRDMFGNSVGSAAVLRATWSSPDNVKVKSPLAWSVDALSLDAQIDVKGTYVLTISDDNGSTQPKDITVHVRDCNSSVYVPPTITIDFAATSTKLYTNNGETSTDVTNGQVNAGTAYEVVLVAKDSNGETVSFTSEYAAATTITVALKDPQTLLQLQGGLKRTRINGEYVQVLSATVDGHYADASKAGKWYIYGSYTQGMEKVNSPEASLDVLVGVAKKMVIKPSVVTINAGTVLRMEGVYFTDEFSNRTPWPSAASDLTLTSSLLASPIAVSYQPDSATAQIGSVTSSSPLTKAGVYQLVSAGNRFAFDTVTVTVEGCKDMSATSLNLLSSWLDAASTALEVTKSGSKDVSMVEVGSALQLEVTLHDSYENACVRSEGQVRLLHDSDVVATFTPLANRPAGTYRAQVALGGFDWGYLVSGSSGKRDESFYVALDSVSGSKQLPVGLSIVVGAASSSSVVSVVNSYQNYDLAENAGKQWSVTEVNNVGACNKNQDCSFTVTITPKDSFGNLVPTAAMTEEFMKKTFRILVAGRFEIDYATQTAGSSSVTLEVQNFANAKDVSGIVDVSVLVNRAAAGSVFKAEFLPAKQEPYWQLSGSGIVGGWRYDSQNDKAVTVKATPVDSNGLFLPDTKFLPTGMKVVSKNTGSSCSSLEVKVEPVASDPYSFTYNLPTCQCSPYIVTVDVPFNEADNAASVSSDQFKVGCERATAGNSYIEDSTGEKKCEFAAAAGKTFNFNVYCKSERGNAMCGDTDIPFQAFVTIDPSACPGGKSTAANIPVQCTPSSDKKSQSCSFTPTYPGVGTVSAMVFGSAVGVDLGCNKIKVTGGQPASIQYSPTLPTLSAGVQSGGSNAISFTVRDQDNNCIPAPAGGWEFTLTQPEGGLPSGAVEDSGSVVEDSNGGNTLVGVFPTISRDSTLVLKSDPQLSIPVSIVPNTDPTQLTLCGMAGTKPIRQDSAAAALFSFDCGWSNRGVATAGSTYTGSFCICDANNNLVTGDLLTSGVVKVSIQQNGQDASSFTATRDQTSERASYSIHGTATLAEQVSIVIAFPDGREFKQLVTVEAGNPDPEQSCFLVASGTLQCANSQSPVAVRASRTPVVLPLVSRDRYGNLRENLAALPFHVFKVDGDNNSSPQFKVTGALTSDGTVVTRNDGSFNLEVSFTALGTYTITSTVLGESDTRKQIYRVTVTAGAAYAPASQLTVLPDSTSIPSGLDHSVSAVAYASAAYINAQLSVKDEFGNPLDSAKLTWKVFQGAKLVDPNVLRDQVINVGTGCVSKDHTAELRVLNSDGTVGGHIRTAGSYQLRACIVPEGEDCANYQCPIGARTETVLFQVWADPYPNETKSLAYVGDDDKQSVAVENKGSALVMVVPRDQYGNNILEADKVEIAYGTDAQFVKTKPTQNSLGLFEVNLENLTLEGHTGGASLTYCPAFKQPDGTFKKMSKCIFISVAPGPLHHYDFTCVSGSPIIGHIPPWDFNTTSDNQQCRGDNCSDKCCCDTTELKAGNAAYVQVRAFDAESNLRAGFEYDWTNAVFQLQDKDNNEVKLEGDAKPVKPRGDGSGFYDFTFIPQKSSATKFHFSVHSIDQAAAASKSDEFGVQVGPYSLQNTEVTFSPEKPKSMHQASFQAYLFDKYLTPTNAQCGADCKVFLILTALDAPSATTAAADTTWQRREMQFTERKADGVLQKYYNVTLDLGMSGNYRADIEVGGQIKTGPSFRIKAGKWDPSQTTIMTPPSSSSSSTSEPTTLNGFKILEKSTVYAMFHDSYGMPLTDEDLAEQEVTSLRLSAARIVSGTVDTVEQASSTYSSKGVIVGGGQSGVVKFTFPGENDIVNYDASMRAITDREGGLPFPEPGRFVITLQNNQVIPGVTVTVYGGPMSKYSFICTTFTKLSSGSCDPSFTTVRGSKSDYCCSKLTHKKNTLVTGYTKPWYLVPVDAGQRFTLARSVVSTPTVTISQSIDSSSSGNAELTLSPNTTLAWDEDREVYVMSWFPEIADKSANFESKVTAMLDAVTLLENERDAVEGLAVRVVSDNCPDSKLRCPGVLCLPNLQVSCDEIPEFDPSKHCVSDYSSCPGMEDCTDCQACANTNQVRCASWTFFPGRCLDSAADCGCGTAGYELCPDQSRCVPSSNTTTCAQVTSNLAGLNNNGAATSNTTSNTTTGEAASFVEITAHGEVKRVAHKQRATASVGSCTNAAAPYYCARTGSCVANELSCASPVTCPAGYHMCSQGYCLDTFVLSKTTNEADKTKAITDACANAAKWEACPAAFPLRCHDGRCVSNMNDCPSQMVCPKGYLRCLSDNACVQSAGKCAAPPICKDNGLTFACPDGSCRAKQSDCPSAPTCTTSDQPFRVLCPDYSCVSDAKDCPAPVQCGAGKVRCPAGNCASNYERCSTPVTCPIGEVKCADGYCAPDTLKCAAREESWNIAPASVKVASFVCPDTRVMLRLPGKSSAEQKALCPTLLSCPFSRPVRCSDNSCVTAVAQCPLSSGVDSVRTLCSKELGRSYRCPNGECRRSAFDCPTDSTCTPEQPVKCQDGSCVLQVSDCLPLPPCPKNKVRCPGSSACAEARDLCPNSVRCNLDEIKCESGRCAKTMQECVEEMQEPVTAVCAKGSFRCPDGTCLGMDLGVEACPTVRICPPEAPVRCDDNSCQPTFMDCPTTSSCNKGMRQCPDGTCAISTCGTAVTCPVTMPVKCWDGSCKPTVTDCPVQRSCPDDLPFLCPDGQCVFSRTYCRTMETCLPNKPIKCPKLQCVSTLAECKDKLIEPGECPFGQTACPDGSCVIHQRDCKEVQCPATKPYRCSNGMCASSPMSGQSTSEECWKDNGCPPQRPFMCWNGACEADASQCKEEMVPKNTCEVAANLTTTSLGQNALGKSNQVLLADSKAAVTTTTTLAVKVFTRCADGVCRSDCSTYEADGCPTGKRRCANGSCVDKTAQCPIMTCPADTPYQCDDGFCSKSRRFCPAEAVAPFKCESNQVACANGLCVSSADLCMPLFKCPTGTKRCLGSSGFVCRNDCGLFSTGDLPNGCPVVNGKRLARCEDGSCAFPGMCRQSDGCLPGYARLAGGNGECKQPTDDKKSDLLLTSELMQVLIYASSLRSPDLVNTADTTALFKEVDDKLAVLNNDLETIADSVPNCPRPLGYGGPDQPFITLDGCDNYRSMACAFSNKNTPIRCADGTCVSKSSDCVANRKCNQICPSGACGDNPANANDCRALNGCPVLTPYLCSGTVPSKNRCAASPLDCPAATSCVPTSPYQCPDGSCVARIDQCKTFTAACADGFERCSSTLTCELKGTCDRVKSFCPVAAPIRCPLGECVSDSKSCFQPKCQHPTPFRCADGTCQLRCPVWKASSIASVRSTTGKCADGYVQCTNGECVESLSKCAIVPSCPADRPARCWSGLCADTPAGCGTMQSCPAGEARCADGLCRSSCDGLRYVGCPVGKVMCPMGECVDSISACRACELSDAMTNGKKLFQCLLGECVEDITKCSTDARNLMLPDIRATVPSYRSSTLNMVDPVSLRTVGSVYVPSGAVEELSQIRVASVAQSEFRDIVRTAPKYIRECTQEEPCLLNAGEEMPYDKMVRTGVIDIGVSSSDRFVFKFPVKVTLMIYQDHLARIMLKDLCLATLTVDEEGKKDWSCSTPEYAQSAVDKLDPATKSLVDSGLKLESTQGNFATLSAWVLHTGKMTVIVDPDYIPPAEAEPGLAWYWWLLIALAIVLVVAGMGYGIWRLYRFRIKYLQSKAYIARLQNEILEVGEMEMNQDIQGATVADQLQGFEFVSNPLFRKDHIEAAKKLSTDQKLKMLEDELQRLRVKTVGQHNEIKSLRKQLARSNASKGRGALDSDDEADDAAEDARDRGGRVEFSAQDADLKDTRDDTLAAGAAAGARAGAGRRPGKGGDKWPEDEDDNATQHSHAGLLD